METKENIKTKMYKSALNYIGVKSLDELDPLIKLMIEALASEIYKLAIDINNIEYRLLDRIAQLLTPDILMAPQPAHTILKAKPVERIATIRMDDSFFYEEGRSVKLYTKKVLFYPVANFKLHKARIGALISDRGYHEISENLDNDLLFPLNGRNDLFSNTIWLGIDIDKELSDVSDLSFYFDFPRSDNPNELISLLPFINWSHNNVGLKSTKGIKTIENKFIVEDDAVDPFFSKYDLTNITNQSVKKLYDPHFITIHDSIKNEQDNYKILPDELDDLFQSGKRDHLKPYLWLKLEFPPNLSETSLNDIFVTLNAFPAVNRELETITLKSNITDIVPLVTRERSFFFSIKSVSDTQNRFYQLLPYKDAQNHIANTYAIRRGGVERMDERDAKEYISDLIDLLRDESVSFSIIGKEYLTESVKNIRTQIFAMEQKLRDIHIEKDINSYLIIDTDDSAENLHIEYWTTSCEYANRIKSGSTFQTITNVDIESKDLVSLTTCKGGKSIPKSKNTLDIFKYILTGRDRIFTSEDIVNHCQSEFGEYFTSIHLSKGVDISEKPKEGLIRTIDINLYVKPNLVNREERFDEIKISLLHSLREKSPDTYNYRVFLK